MQPAGQQPDGADANDEPAEPQVPEDPRFDAAEAALADGDYAGARERFQAILDAEPANAAAALALHQVALLARVDGFGDVAADPAPDDLDGQLAAADLGFVEGDPDSALRRLLDLLARTTGDDRELVRQRLIEYFELLGPDDPRVGPARTGDGTSTVLSDDDARDRIRELVATSEADPVAPFALRPDKQYVFSPDGAAAVAYRVRLRTAVASGDPLGAGAVVAGGGRRVHVVRAGAGAACRGDRDGRARSPALGRVRTVGRADRTRRRRASRRIRPARAPLPQSAPSRAAQRQQRCQRRFRP